MLCKTCIHYILWPLIKYKKVQIFFYTSFRHKARVQFLLTLFPITRDTRGIVVIIIRSGPGHQSSSPDWGSLHFYIELIHLGKVWIQLFSIQLWVNSRVGWFSNHRTVTKKKENSEFKPNLEIHAKPILQEKQPYNQTRVQDVFFFYSS